MLRYDTPVAHLLTTLLYNVIVTTCHVAMRNFLYVVALALRPSVDPRSSKHPSRQLFTPGALGGLSAARLVMLNYIFILRNTRYDASPISILV